MAKKQEQTAQAQPEQVSQVEDILKDAEKNVDKEVVLKGFI